MSFVKFENSNTTKSGYKGINVGISSVNFTKDISMLMKTYEWERIDIFIDKGVESVLFKRNDKDGTFGVKWGRPVHAKLYKEGLMKQGRYYLVDANTAEKGELTFKRSIIDPSKSRGK